MRLRMLGGMVLVAVLGCENGAQLAAPSFGAGNAPASSGQVFRFDGFLSVLLVDAESGLQAWHGWDVVSFCQGTGGNDDLLSFQIVTNPNEALRELRKTHGDAQVSVWPVGPNTCARYATETPQATGVVNFRGTDNDVAPFNRPDPKNTNAFGWMANGNVTGADGASLRYQASYRGHWDGSDPASIVEHTNIRLH